MVVVAAGLTVRRKLSGPGHKCGRKLSRVVYHPGLFFLPVHVGFLDTIQWTPIGKVMSLSVAMHSASLPSDSNHRASVSAALIFFSTSSSVCSTV
jgi:hypothetical protein